MDMNSEEQTTFNQQQTINNSFEKTKRGTKKLPFILLVISLILIISGIGFMYYQNNDPVAFYQNTIKKVIDKSFEGITTNYDKTSTTFGWAAKINLIGEETENEVIDLINKTDLKLNIQVDYPKEQVVLKLDSNYDKESLVDLELFINSKDKETYIRGKDYFDKYIQWDLDEDFYLTFSEMFKEINTTKVKVKDINKSKKILKKEMSKIITRKDCTKKDGALVFKITEKELANRLKTMLTNLKNNKEFLIGYENAESIKDSITSFLDLLDIGSLGNNELKITVKKDMFSSEFNELTFEYNDVKIIFTANNNVTKYEVLSGDVKILDGHIKNEKVKNTDKTEFLINIPLIGNITLYYDFSMQKNINIETVDKNNSVKYEDLSQKELSEIQYNIENSKLYDLIGQLGLKEEEEFEEEYNGILNTDTTTMIEEEFSMSAPSNFTDYSNEYQYSYEYEHGSGVFDSCTVRFNSPLGYKTSENLIEQMATYYSELYNDGQPILVKSSTVNGITWNWFSYEDSFGTNYYYGTTKNDKVYLLEYEFDEDVVNECEKYRQEFLNSITKK